MNEKTWNNLKVHRQMNACWKLYMHIMELFLKMNCSIYITWGNWEDKYLKVKKPIQRNKYYRISYYKESKLVRFIDYNVFNKGLVSKDTKFHLCKMSKAEMYNPALFI